MNRGTSVKKFKKSGTLRFECSSNSHNSTQNFHQNEPETRRAEPHSQCESWMGRTPEYDDEYPQQELDNPQDFSDLNKLQHQVPSNFEGQKLRQKVDSQKETTQNQLVELHQSSQGQEEVVLLYPTYSDLMEENRELKKWNNDLLVENEEAKKQLECANWDNELEITQRLKEAEKDKKVMEDRLKVLEGKLNQKLDEVVELRNQNKKMKTDVEDAEFMKDRYRDWWSDSVTEVRKLRRKMEEKWGAKGHKSRVPKQGHMVFGETKEGEGMTRDLNDVSKVVKVELTELSNLD
ncbi:unnamed protein product [Orchesella dallaii]|uniref:Uncharacterized protein n=1 Tax=Orchesella dallaii TaxID=48710 RepID=A0ABP1S702_9HEXA